LHAGLTPVAGGWIFYGRPTDTEYGLLIQAADAVLIGDQIAYGSMTVHAAVELRRPVISVTCPATEELVGLGLCARISELCPDQISEALLSLSMDFSDASFQRFLDSHDDSRVARALQLAYQIGNQAVAPGLVVDRTSV
jgi:hypothetical protein